MIKKNSRIPFYDRNNQVLFVFFTRMLVYKGRADILKGGGNKNHDTKRIQPLIPQMRSHVWGGFYDPYTSMYLKEKNPRHPVAILRSYQVRPGVKGTPKSRGSWDGLRGSFTPILTFGIRLDV